MKKRIMAIYSHADDIEGNVGGTALKYLPKGYELIYVMSTNNMSGSWNSLDAEGRIVSRPVPWYEIMPQRKLEAAKAAAQLHTVPIHLNHPQRHFRDRDQVLHTAGHGAPAVDCAEPEITILTAHESPAARKQIADLVEKYQPEAVFTHDTIQVDLEHIGTSLLVTRALKECGYKGMILLSPCVDVPFCGEIYNSRQTWVDITDTYQGKLDLIAIHACQMPKIDHLTFRPWEKGTGCKHVEAFAMVQPGESGGELRDELLAHWEKLD